MKSDSKQGITPSGDLFRITALGNLAFEDLRGLPLCKIPKDPSTLPETNILPQKII